MSELYCKAWNRQHWAQCALDIAVYGIIKWSVLFMSVDRTFYSRITWRFVVFFIPFILQYNYILNTFYHFGAPYNDAGLFAQLLWHNDWSITNPRPNGDYSYFAVHFSPFLALINQLSHFLPFYRVEFYAGFMASIYASFALTMLYVLDVCIKPRNYWQMACLSALAVGYSFNGIIMQGVWMPHFEYAIPLGIFLFILHYSLGHFQWAIFFFILTLSMREDAGFHTSAVLGLLTIIKCYKTRSWQAIRFEAYFILTAFLYSSIAWWSIHHIRASYGVDGTIFELIYTGGTPAYAHLNWQLLLTRLQKIGVESLYLWVGFLVTLLWTIHKRNIYFAIGFCAYIPWFIFDWTAYNNNTGVLYAYYAFPFVLSMGWPLLAMLWQFGPSFPKVAVYEATMLQVALIVIGLIVWDTDAHRLGFAPSQWTRWGSYRLQKGVENRQLTRDFIVKLNFDSAALGVVMVDDGVGSLAVGQTEGRELVLLNSQEPVDSIAYFNPYSGMPGRNVLEQVQKNDLPYHYRVVGTPIYVFSNREPDNLGVFTQSLAEQ